MADSDGKIDVDEIRALRDALGVSQEELAAILGVSKATIVRYETPTSSRPQGDTERKLIQLKNFLADEEDRKKIEDLKKSGGVASLAGLLAVSSALFPVSAAAAKGIRLASILASPALGALGALGVAGIGAYFVGKKIKKNKKEDK